MGFNLMTLVTILSLTLTSCGGRDISQKEIYNAERFKKIDTEAKKAITCMDELSEMLGLDPEQVSEIVLIRDINGVAIVSKDNNGKKELRMYLDLDNDDIYDYSPRRLINPREKQAPAPPKTPQENYQEPWPKKRQKPNPIYRNRRGKMLAGDYS